MPARAIPKRSIRKAIKTLSVSSNVKNQFIHRCQVNYIRFYSSSYLQNTNFSFMKRFAILCSFVLSAFMAQSQQQNISLNHIAFYVEDVAKSARFYKEVIGLDTVPEPFRDGLHAWFKVGVGLTLHLIQGTKEKLTQYRNTHTSFRVADVNAFIEHIAKMGIRFEDVNGTANTVTTRPDGVKQIYFKDPDGYWIEINNAKI